MPGLIYDSVKFTASAWFSPLPTGYCITKNNFVKSVEQAKSMLATVQQCAKDQINKFGQKDEVVDTSAPVAPVA